MSEQHLGMNENQTIKVLDALGHEHVLVLRLFVFVLPPDYLLRTCGQISFRNDMIHQVIPVEICLDLVKIVVFQIAPVEFRFGNLNRKIDLCLAEVGLRCIDNRGLLKVLRRLRGKVDWTLVE